MIGETVGARYTVVRLLGEGGMGAVYEARHVGTGRRVGLKVITGELAKYRDAVARFQIEARAQGAIDSQHIVQVLDTGWDEQRDVPFLAMEFLTGDDLRHVFRRTGVLPPHLALRIVAQACIGLGKAHAARIIHRDIKPANIFLAERDGGELVVKILDFGIAKCLEDEAGRSDKELTRTGSLLGSPLYMSPEQARGHKDIDARTDVWSLGILLYRALVGRTPHTNSESVGDIIVSICSVPTRPVQDSSPWVQPEIAQIVETAVQIDPRKRYADAAEMYRAIRALLPGGHNIEKSMLRTISEEEKRQRAQRSPTAPAPAPLEVTAATTISDLHPVRTTGALISTSDALPPARSRSLLVFLLGMLVAAGAFAIYRLAMTPVRANAAPPEPVTAPAPPSAAEPPASASEAPPVASAAPPVRSDASARPSASPSASAAQRPRYVRPGNVPAPARTYDPLNEM